MKKLNIKKLLLLVMALTLISVQGSFSWIEGLEQGGYVKLNQVVITSGGGLVMKQNGEITDNITASNFKLDEVSSSDGRNYFFPMTNTDTNNFGLTRFRKGTPADRNKRYVCVDFTLEASDENFNKVYLGSGTLVKCSNVKLMDALRMSLSFNDGSNPMVFKPTQVAGETANFSPITSIHDEGNAIQTSVNSKSYCDYYYRGEDVNNHIFDFTNRKVLNVTLSIWLEGTAFDYNDELESELSIFFQFTTPEDLVKYCFEDDCHAITDAQPNNWISDRVKDNGVEHETLMYVFDKDTQQYYAMQWIKDTTRWIGYIPKNVTDFYFRRYSFKIDKWWNQWEPDMQNIPVVNDERTYVAIYGYETVDGTTWEQDGGYGYWKDEKDTIRVYFQLENAWDNLRCFITGSGGTHPLAERPGVEMIFSHYAGDSNSQDNSVSKPVYYIDIPDRKTITTIEFNNSDINQRLEISDSHNFFNGLYVTFKDYSNQKTIYLDPENSLIYPINDPTP